MQASDELAGIDPSLAAVAAAVRGASAEMDEAGRTLARYAGRAGSDPHRLEVIEERLELLRRLARKHGGSLAAALQRRETMNAELQSLEHHDESLAAAQERVRDLGERALQLGRALSEKRRAAAAGFSRAVAAELSALGMARTEISVRFGPAGEGGIPVGGEVLGPRGLESAELLLSPNPGEELRPLGAGRRRAGRLSVHGLVRPAGAGVGAERGGERGEDLGDSSGRDGEGEELAGQRRQGRRGREGAIERSERRRRGEALAHDLGQGGAAGGREIGGNEVGHGSHTSHPWRPACSCTGRGAASLSFPATRGHDGR